MHALAPRALALGLGLCLALSFTASQLKADDSPAGLSPAAQSDTPARLQSLEQSVAQLQKSLDSQSIAGVILVKPTGREPYLSVGGLLQAQGEFGEKGDSRYTSGNSRFYLRRSDFWAQGRFLEDYDFKIGFGMTDTLANNTTATALSLSGMDAYITGNFADALKLRVGQFKSPFGAEWLTPDPELPTPERSLGSDRLTMNRQIGAMLLGDLADKRLGYNLALVNGDGRNLTANDNNEFFYLGRLTAVPWRKGDSFFKLGAGGGSGLQACMVPGASGSDFKLTTSTAGTTNTFTGRETLASGDASLKLGLVEASGEYLRAWWDSTPAVKGKTVKNFLEEDSESIMGQVSVLLGKIQPVAKYESFMANMSLQRAPVETWTLGVNYLVKGNDLKVMLDYVDTHDSSACNHSMSKVITRLQTLF